jgi:hypothetical protein
MGVMMLHLDEAHAPIARPLASELSGQRFWMAIHDQRLRLMAEAIGVAGEAAAEVVERGGVLKVAVMPREHGLAAPGEAEGRLQLTTHGEHIGRALESARQSQAMSHSRTRLLPESATTSVLPHAATAYGQHTLLRVANFQRFSPLSLKLFCPASQRASPPSRSKPSSREFAVSATIRRSPEPVTP